MGTGYTRNDTGNNIADGNVINAADFDGEYDAIEAAFNSSSGHTHDGTSAEGAPIEVLGPSQDVVITASVLRPKTNNTVDLGTASLKFKDAHFEGTVNVDGGLTPNQISIKSTDAGVSKGPQLDLFRESASPADNDALGHIDFSGEDDGDNKTIYASILATAADVTGGTEDGTLKFNTMVDGSDTTVMEISSGSVSITNATNDAQLTLISTDADASIGPLFVMNRNSSSPADNDQLGKIQFLGEDDADNSTVYSQIVNQIKDASNGTEDGRMSFNIITAGADRSFINMTHDSTQAEVVINEESIDLDFRVESDGNANMLFVDGEDDAVIIGHNASRKTLFNTTATAALQIEGTTANTAAMSIARNSNDDNGPQFVFAKSNGTAGAAVTVVTADALLGRISWQGADGTQTVEGARIEAFVDGTPGANDMPGTLTISTTADGAASPTERMRIDSSGKVGIGINAPASQLHLSEETSNTTTRSDQIRIHAASSGTTGVGFGSSILFTGERANGTLQQMGRFGFAASTNTSSNLSSDFIIETGNAGTPAERMRITNLGNVKIGDATTDITSKLTVSGNASADVATFMYDGAAGTYFDIDCGAADGTVELRADARSGAFPPLVFQTGGAEQVRIDKDGRVGIGAVPNTNMHVATFPGTLAIGDQGVVFGNADSLQLGNNYYWNGSAFKYLGTGKASRNYHTAGNIVWDTTDSSGSADGALTLSERMRITSAGNVGIGTSAPDTLLTLQTTTAGTISAGNNRGGAVIKLHHEGQWESGYGNDPDDADNDFLGGIEFSSGDSSNGEGVRAAIRGTVDSYFNTNSIVFETAPSAATGVLERMRVNHSGQVRLGRASSAAMSNALTIDSGNTYTALGIKRTTGVTTGTGELGVAVETNSQITFSYDDQGSIVFGTAGTPSTAAGFTERVRISASGEFFIGKTGEVSTQDGFQFKQTGECIVGRGSNDTMFIFQDTNSSGATVGSISMTSSNTAYNTSSDYRLKENVTDVSDGITRVKQLQPRRFNFIVNPDTEIVDGFIAHEVSAIVPEAITGEKDAVKEENYQVTPAELDSDGRIVKEAVMGTRTVPDMQQIDQSKIVPLLTAALKEAIAKIETLETKVAALEG